MQQCLILILFLLIFTAFFFISSNLINKKNKTNSDNLVEITQSNEFTNLKNFIFSKINSPYEEIDYVIKNNDIHYCTIYDYLKYHKIKSELNDDEIRKILKVDPKLFFLGNLQFD